jgi:archaetidylinositol phosphate synthase
MTTNADSIRNGVSFSAAQRVNRSLTAAAERRALEWMARRAPGWVTSDRLTVLGLSAQIGAGAFYALAAHYRSALIAVCVCLALNWLGDSLDGTLARVRRQQRPRYGFYVDHMVDIFGATALMCGLGFSGFLHWHTAMAMLVTFLLLSGESYLATYTLHCFEMSQGFFGPTEIRILLIAGNFALLRSPYSTVFGHQVLLFDLGGMIAAAGMLAMAIVVSVRHTAALYRQEPLNGTKAGAGTGL